MENPVEAKYSFLKLCNNMFKRMQQFGVYLMTDACSPSYAPDV